MKVQEIVDFVEGVVCNHVGVSIEQMLEDTKKGACVKARHLSIFILHCTFGLSIRQLCNRYGFSVRHFFRISQQMRDYISYSYDYRDLYDKIMADIKPFAENLSIYIEPTQKENE